MIDLILFAGIAGAFIWLYIHDRKIEKPIINVIVNVPNSKGENKQTEYTPTTTKKTKAISIEEPDRSDDWLKVEPTDSN